MADPPDISNGISAAATVAQQDAEVAPMRRNAASSKLLQDTRTEAELTGCGGGLRAVKRESTGADGLDGAPEHRPVADKEPVAMTAAPRPIARRDVYRHPVVAGRERPNTFVSRLVARLKDGFTSSGERREQLLNAGLSTLPPVSRTNVIAVLSPKGGVGKTTSTYLIGDALADLGRSNVVAVDANPDYGTLGLLAPDAIRSDLTLADLLERFEERPSFAQLRPFLSQVPSGLKLLRAPADEQVMRAMKPEQYDKLLALLAQHVEVVLLDCGTGLAGDLAQWAISRADQVVIVTTPDWMTSNNVAGALGLVRRSEQATLVLNQARSRGPGDQRAIEEHFRRQAIDQRVTIPYDEQLRTMLDTATYDLAQLKRPTRLAIKQLAALMGEGLR